MVSSGIGVSGSWHSFSSYTVKLIVKSKIVIAKPGTVPTKTISAKPDSARQYADPVKMGRNLGNWFMNDRLQALESDIQVEMAAIGHYWSKL
jgi:hypothetical protein